MCARARKGEAQGVFRVTGCNHNKEQPPCEGQQDDDGLSEYAVSFCHYEGIPPLDGRRDSSDSAFPGLRHMHQHHQLPHTERGCGDGQMLASVPRHRRCWRQSDKEKTIRPLLLSVVHGKMTCWLGNTDAKLHLLCKSISRCFISFGVPR